MQVPRKVPYTHLGDIEVTALEFTPFMPTRRKQPAVRIIRQVADLMDVSIQDLQLAKWLQLRIAEVDHPKAIGMKC